MRVLALGDVFGAPGRQLVRALLPALREEERIDLVVANAENSAGGLGTTPETARDLLEAGVQVLTGGNHTWKHRELHKLLDEEPRLLRPANYPRGAPGRGAGVFRLADGRSYAVVNLIGRVFLEQGVDSPFALADRLLEELSREAPVILIDFHAEASSEKRAMGVFVDGRASAIWGTHTHVPTADEEILPRGTAYLSDVGMTGPYASVIGLDPELATRKFVSGLPSPYRVADGNMQLRGLLIDVDEATGRATEARRVTRRP